VYNGCGGAVNVGGAVISTISPGVLVVKLSQRASHHDAIFTVVMVLILVIFSVILNILAHKR